MERQFQNVQGNFRNNMQYPNQTPQPDYNQVYTLSNSNYKQNQGQSVTQKYNGEYQYNNTPGNSQLGVNNQPKKQDQDYYSSNLSYQQEMMKQQQQNNQRNMNYPYQQTPKGNEIKNEKQQASAFHGSQNNSNFQRQEVNKREFDQRGQQGINNNAYNNQNESYFNQQYQKSMDSQHKYPVVQQQNNIQYNETPSDTNKYFNQGQKNSTTNKYQGYDQSQKQKYGEENTYDTPGNDNSQINKNRIPNQQSNQQNSQNQNNERHSQSKIVDVNANSNRNISGSQLNQREKNQIQESHLTLDNSRLINASQITQLKSTFLTTQTNNSEIKQNQDFLKSEITPSKIVYQGYEKDQYNQSSSKIGHDMEQSKNGCILEMEESHIDADEVGLFNTLEKQGNVNNNNRLYSQYQKNYQEENQQQKGHYFYQKSIIGKQESLFKYPSMFESIGQIYQSQGAQQELPPRFNSEEAMQNIKSAYEGHPQKLKMFEDLVKQYLIDQEQVQIKFINRHITGLQSAENLGDFFIRKYSSNQEKRVAGCSRAQVFPVYIGVRGDGNCFYRALIVSYLVHLLTREENIEKYEQFIFDISENKHPIIDLEYQNKYRNDSVEVKIILMQQLLLLLLERKQAKSKDEVSLFLMKMFDSISSDHDFDYSLVSLCRSMITQALDQYGTKPIYSEYFLQEDMEQTRLKLSTYKEDAEYHAINLSTEIFRHPIQILQLQKNKYGHFEFNESVVYSPQVNQPEEGNIYILLNDGHYDLVFDRETCLDYFPSLSLFKDHQKYSEDLQELIENSNTQENQKQYYLRLMEEYKQFLKEQNHQVVKVRESYANMQSLYQSKIAKYPSPSQSNLAQCVDGNENLISLSDKSTIKNNNDKQSKLIDLTTTNNLSTIKENSDQQNLQGNQSSNIFINTSSKVINLNQVDINIDKQNDQLSYQKQNQIKNYQESSLSQPQNQANHFFQSNFYNIESNKIQKIQNFQSTPMGNFDANTKKNIKQIHEQKDLCISCDHASNSNLTIKNITCCKIQYEVCFSCFKTRQIIQCSICKKEILSHTRVAQTTKNWQYHCSKCKQKPQEVIIFFNQIYCQKCELQNQ